MEPVTLALGTIATKWVVRLWIPDAAAADMSVDLVDLVRGHVSGVMESRRAGREFEQLAESMADRLQPFLQHEYRGVDAPERTAACAAVESSLGRALEQGIDVIALDLDAALLEREIRLADPDASANALLGDGGSALYDLLLSECCSYIVAAVVRLPSFGSEAAREMLARNSRLIEIGEEVLDRLPRTMPAEWGAGSDDEIFKSKYLKAVVQKHDRLQIFGLRDRSFRAHYPLSVAYISLSATVPTASTQNAAQQRLMNVFEDEDEGKPLDKSPNFEDDFLRVESALSGHARLLLGGGAGSGKTTLLQWIAVTASQSDFTGELESWNGLVPFYIPLRRFVDKDFPAPEGFVGISHPSLSGAMPPGWAHRILASGGATVLVDGLDELPEDRRSAARLWLIELMGAFPDSRYVVTSRPLAVSREWQQVPDFKYSELLPMQRSDIRAFIAHWHAAAQASGSENEKAEIAAACRHMLAAIALQPTIRMLCTTPLLCALICAMHRQNVNKLPENRMELYDTALQMLVSSRDEEREVVTGSSALLSFSEKRALLADFALWLHEDGASDAERETYEQRVAGKTSQLARRNELDAVEVADELLLRSGVLRIPVEGRVDFVHRTFLEYLAAAQLVDDDALGKIIDHAHLDQWREVVIMAAGHFSARRREEFLIRLVQRGRDEPSVQHRLFFLAVACIETSPVLSEGVQEMLVECLDEIVPPQNMTDAAAVASAGSLAVPRLGDTNVLATTAAACIRSLSLIGTDEALEVIARYRTDSRVTVARQLIRAWGQFDAEQYVRTVLCESPLDYGHIVLTDADNIKLLDQMKYAEAAFLDLPGKVRGIDELAPSDIVTGVNFSRSQSISDLHGIDRYPMLNVMWIENAPALESLSGLNECSRVSTVYLDNNPRLLDISDLAAYETLDTVHLHNSGVRSIHHLQSTRIGVLRVGGWFLERLPPSLSVRDLSVTYADKVTDLDVLGSWSDLVRLTVRVSQDVGLKSIRVPPSVRHVMLSGMGQSDLSIRGADGVEQLFLGELRAVDLPFMPDLEYLSIASRSAAECVAHDANRFNAFPSLRSIRISGRGSRDIEIPGFVQEEGGGRPGYSARFTRDL